MREVFLRIENCMNHRPNIFITSQGSQPFQGAGFRNLPAPTLLPGDTKMEIKIPQTPSYWICPVCGKWDSSETDAQLASPEHRTYRGIDLGSCKGIMISLFTREAIQQANKG